MRRAFKWVGIILAVVVFVPVLLVAIVLGGLNTGAGQRLLETQVGSLTGGMVSVSGVSGSFPGAPRVGRIEVRDADGVWLTIEDAALDWSPLALASGVAHVNRLSAGHATVARLPKSGAQSASPPSSGSFSLPVRVDVDALHVDRIDVAAPVAGRAIALDAEGGADVRSLSDGTVHLSLNQVGGQGLYQGYAKVDDTGLHTIVTVNEPESGLVTGLAGLPGIGSFDAGLAADGPWSALVTDLTMAAGPLHLSAKGKLDLVGYAADLDIAANARQMAPRADVAWEGITLDAHAHGPFTRPQASGQLHVDRLRAAGVAIETVTAQLSGDAGQAAIDATVSGVTLPGPRPDLLGADPLTARITARLDAPDRPVTFAVHHKLLTIDGTAQTAAPIRVAAQVTAPDLAPLAAIGGVDVRGHMALAVKAMVADTIGVELDGPVVITGGLAPLPGLVGEASLGATASLHGSDVTLSRLTVDGKAIKLSGTGSLAGTTLAADATVELADLSVLAPTVSGSVKATAHVSGRTDDFAAKLELAGDVATAGVPRGPIHAAIDAAGLPASPSGAITAEGTLDEAPLALAAKVTREGGALNVAIERADWRSAHAEGGVALAAGASLPVGKLTVRMTRLEDLRRLLGQPLAGSVTATADLSADAAILKLEARNAGLAGTAEVGQATLAARVADPTTHPMVQAKLTAAGVRAGGLGGSLVLDANGPQEALALKLTAALDDLAGAGLKAASAVTLDVPGKRVAIASLTADWRGQNLRLLAPARIAFGDAVSVDRLRLGLGAATLDVAGRATPTLSLTAALRGVTPDLLAPFAPNVRADGVLTADVKLTGTPARPDGTVRIAATGLRARSGAAASLPPANVTVNATLAGGSARLDAAVSAGANRVTLAGTAPIGAGALNLHAGGNLDLTVLDPVLTAQGQRARGRLTLDATIRGTTAAPRIDGGATLTGGEVQDFAQQLRIDQIQARLIAAGSTVRIDNFSGRAGAGSLSATGSVGVAAPMPVDLHLVMRKASPFSGDRITAVLDTDLTLRGAVAGDLAAGGTITIQRAEIRVPERLPTKVAVLAVHRPGDRPPPPPAAAPNIGLNVTLNAPGQIFVRGRGLDAELEGSLRIGGTAAAPRPDGSFKLRRGTFSLAGETLTFTSGEVGFDGSGKIDPTLNFVASSTSGSVTATLTVTGYASAPKIALSSTPELPQDEVLARLLFSQGAASLSPFQLAEIAAALAQISGVGGGGFDPLNSARRSLGLDRLSVGGGSGSTGANVEAGRYVARGVYVGAKQATSGGGTSATVQVDLARGLKLQTQIGTGGSAATGSSGATSGGSNVGVTYQFEY